MDPSRGPRHRQRRKHPRQKCRLCRDGSERYRPEVWHPLHTPAQTNGENTKSERVWTGDESAVNTLGTKMVEMTNSAAAKWNPV